MAADCSKILQGSQSANDFHALVLVLLSPPAAELPAAALSSVAATASASVANDSFKLGLQVTP